MNIATSPSNDASRRRGPLKLLFFGFLTWLPVFAVAGLLQAWREEDFPLKLTVLAVAMTIATAILSRAYVVESRGTMHGVAAGLTWMGIHLVLGLGAFVGGPLQMPIARFGALAACTLIIPIVTVGVARRAASRR